MILSQRHPATGACGDAGGAPVQSLPRPVAGSHPTLPLTSREKQTFRKGRWPLQGAPELYSVLPDLMLPAKYSIYLSGTTNPQGGAHGLPESEAVHGEPAGWKPLPTRAVLLGVQSGPAHPAVTTGLACSFPRAGSGLGRGRGVVRQPPSRNSAYHSAISGSPPASDNPLYHH